MLYMRSISDHHDLQCKRWLDQENLGVQQQKIVRFRYKFALPPLPAEFEIN